MLNPVVEMFPRELGLCQGFEGGANPGIGMRALQRLCADLLFA